MEYWDTKYMTYMGGIDSGTRGPNPRTVDAVREDALPRSEVAVVIIGP